MGPPGEPQGEDVARAQAALQQMTNGYWVTQIIYVAARFGIADLLKDGPRTISELARSTRTHAPTLYRVMRALSGLGVFRENDDGTFEAIMNGEEWYRAWGGLLESLRTGETAFDHVFGMPFFEYLSANAGSAAIFNEAMASSTELAARAVAEVYDLSGVGTIVDVGGGTGAFLAGILMANPQARGVLFDRPDVVADANGILTGAGVASRCAVIAGDFLEAVPSGGGAYILSWIIHDWDDDRAVTILKNCRRAMADDARLLILEQVVPRGNEPSLSKLYDLHMLVLYRGRERREDEYRALLAAANLHLARVIPTRVPRSVIEALPR
jgi:hypothetical protein